MTVPKAGSADRVQLRTQFLADAGWGDASITPLAADASTRAYSRLFGGGKHGLLMDAPPGAEAAACPPSADAVARRALGYNAMARLAGPRMEAFVAVARWLREAGVRAPTVYADDSAHGFAVIEDFGNRHLVDAATSAAAEADLYRRALNVLGKVRAHKVSPGDLGGWPLQTYDTLAMQVEADLLIEWYAPHAGLTLTEDAMVAWQKAWAHLFDQLSAPHALILRDFHAQNILVPDDGPLAVIDFQDALFGHAAYDAVSLIEDARRDVDLGLAAELVAEDARQTPDPIGYEQDYAILAAQRNAKILGIFARLIHRDGKDAYGAFFPRVEAHFARDLDRPTLGPLRSWFERYLPQLLSDGRG